MCTLYVVVCGWYMVVCVGYMVLCVVGLWWCTQVRGRVCAFLHDHPPHPQESLASEVKLLADFNKVILTCVLSPMQAAKVLCSASTLAVLTGVGLANALHNLEVPTVVARACTMRLSWLPPRLLPNPPPSKPPQHRTAASPRSRCCTSRRGLQRLLQMRVRCTWKAPERAYQTTMGVSAQRWASGHGILGMPTPRWVACVDRVVLLRAWRMWVDALAHINYNDACLSLCNIHGVLDRALATFTAAAQGRTLAQAHRRALVAPLIPMLPSFPERRHRARCRSGNFVSL